jgi:hypothetical protein
MKKIVAMVNWFESHQFLAILLAGFLGTIILSAFVRWLLKKPWQERKASDVLFNQGMGHVNKKTVREKQPDGSYRDRIIEKRKKPKLKKEADKIGLTAILIEFPEEAGITEEKAIDAAKCLEGIYHIRFGQGRRDAKNFNHYRYPVSDIQKKTG